MNSTHPRQNKNDFANAFRAFLQRRKFRHDPWLVFNMASFNSEGSWNRIFDPLRATTISRC